RDARQIDLSLDPFELMTAFPAVGGNFELLLVAAILHDNDQIDRIDLAATLSHRTPVEREGCLFPFGNAFDIRQNDTGLISGFAEFEIVLLKIDTFVFVLAWIPYAQELVPFGFERLQSRYSV